MRAYRPRKRGAPAIAKPATKTATAPRIDASIPLGRELTRAEKRGDAQLEAIEARGGTAVWTGDRWQEAPKRTPASAAHSKGVSSNGVAICISRPSTTPPSRTLTLSPPPLRGEVIPPPRSMVADGGSPPRRYAPDASIAEATALIRTYAAQQARVNEDMARRLAVVEREQAETARRLAAIEQRRTGIVAVVQGLASIFSLL